MSTSIRRTVLRASILLVAAASFRSRLHAQSAGPLQFVPRAQLLEPGHTLFGRSLSLSGDDLVVRTGPDNPGAQDQFVYHRAAGVWSPQATLPLQNGYNCLDFCMSRQTDVSIAGNVLAVGKPGCHGNSGAFLSARSGTAWSPPQEVGAEYSAEGFGAAALVHPSGIVLIGAPETGFPGFFALYRLTGSVWETQNAIGATTLEARPKYGSTLSLSGTTLLVGAERRAEVLEQGATSLVWTFQAALVPPDGGRLRTAVVDGNVAVLSTSSDCSGPSGVYVFERSGTTWTLTGTLVASDSIPPALGKSLLVRDQTIYAGAPSADSSDGAVYVFQRQAGAWTQTAKLKPNPSLPAGSRFGSALAGDGSILCVGAPGTGSDTGTVQVFDVLPLPPPVSYCTAKVNSQGCLPQMSSSGIASATSPNPFFLMATNVLNNKTGLLLYTIAGSANVPFQGGTRCFALPFRRTPGQNSGGNPPPNDCSGNYSFDFNARIRSGIDATLTPGRQVWCQYYSRDPGDPFQVGLTDAVTFVIGS